MLGVVQVGVSVKMTFVIGVGDGPRIPGCEKAA